MTHAVHSGGMPCFLFVEPSPAWNTSPSDVSQAFSSFLTTEKLNKHLALLLFLLELPIPSASFSSLG